MNKSFEVRLHGRGGQGGVTCAKILASVYAHLGRSVQTFGDYAGERSGAPVRAYTRVSDEPITNRNKVYHPDELLVLDDSLLGADTLEGLVPGGSLLVNTTADLAAFDAAGGERYAGFTVGVVDATRIARAHGIGTRSVVIVNTTLAGAYARMHDVPLDVLEQTYKDLGLAGNFAAAVEAYEAVALREPLEAPDAEYEDDSLTVPTGALPEVGSLTDHVASPPTGLPTGTWSSQRPEYVENLAPCNAWCPAGNDVVGFVQALATITPNGRTPEGVAAELLGRSTPLAATCGRVCPAPCMEGCNRIEHDGSVNIRALERWIADVHPVAPTQSPVLADGITQRRIAIVGGGPAGLGAAFELQKAGHQTTIYEGEQRLGGVLRTGIPTYRLPREVLDREVDGVLALGAEARCGEFLTKDRVADLSDEYDAVVLATGLQRLRGLDVEGADLDGIEQGIRFLHGVNFQKPGRTSLSGHVVVLGGGNTAMDCARSALRDGADSVTVAYRRSRKEIPAIAEEIHEAELEGVVFETLRAPVGFRNGKQHGGRVSAVVLAEVELGEPDEDGRRRPLVTERTVELACDHVLLALGQSGDYSLLPEGWEMVWDEGERGSETWRERGTVWSEGKPLCVFGAGDLATGEGTVTHAIGSGRRAAGLALAALEALPTGQLPFHRPDKRNAVSATRINLDHFPRIAPSSGTTMDPAASIAGFEEVNAGLEASATTGEASRCFSCGHCTACDTCLVYCPEGIIRRKGDDGEAYAVDYTYCKGCGICVEECPRQAMEMTTP